VLCCVHCVGLRVGVGYVGRCGWVGWVGGSTAVDCISRQQGALLQACTRGSAAGPYPSGVYMHLSRTPGTCGQGGGGCWSRGDAVLSAPCGLIGGGILQGCYLAVVQTGGMIDCDIVFSILLGCRGGLLRG